MNNHTIIEESQKTIFSNIPEDIFLYNLPQNKLRDGYYPKVIREILYRLNATKDFFKGNYPFAKIQLDRIPIHFLLSLMGGFSTNDIQAYGYKNNDILLKILTNYIGYFRRWEYRERLNCQKYAQILSNKILTNVLLRSSDIPTTNQRCVFFKGKSYEINDNLFLEKSQVISNLDSGEYIYKPSCQRWGVQIGAITILEKGKSYRLNGHEIKYNELTKFLLELSKKEPFIVEVRVLNHPSLSVLSKNSLNTIRIMTVRTKNNSIIPFSAALRFSITGALVDNWSSGGLAASVDIKTGKVGRFFAKKNTPPRISKFKGLKEIPNWDDVLSLSVKAHEACEQVFSIGWDIAITPDNTLVIEGNDDWDIVLPQRVMQKGLWETSYKYIK